MKNKYKKYEETIKSVNGIRYKECRDCLDWYPETLEHFAKRSGNKGGLNIRCIDCQRKRDQAYYEKNREKIISDSQRSYWENKPQRQQYHKERQEGWGREKYLARQKKYHKEHREQGRERHKRFIKMNPDKAKQYQYDRMHKDHRISDVEWINCKNYFDNKCAYCELPIEEHYNLFKGKIILTDFHKEHVDHEGDNDLGNCIPSCKSCNSEKHTYTLDEWYNDKNIKYKEYRYTKIKKWINEDYLLYIEEK